MTPRLSVRPALLQIGGSALAEENFAQMRPFLADACRVVDVALPPFEAGPDADFVAESAAHIIAAAEALDHDGPVALHGISSGGAAVIGAAARRPDLFDGLIVGGTHLRPNAGVRLWRSTWVDVARRLGMEPVADLIALAGVSSAFWDTPGAAAHLAWLRTAFGAQSVESFTGINEWLAELDLREEARSISLPTLLMNSSLDVMDPPYLEPGGTGLGDAFSLLENCALVLFDDCGHCYFLERPRDAAQIVLDFVHGAELTALPGTTVQSHGEPMPPDRVRS